MRQPDALRIIREFPEAVCAICQLDMSEERCGRCHVSERANALVNEITDGMEAMRDEDVTKDEKRRSGKRFRAPSVEEVIEYAESVGSTRELAVKFHEYFSAGNWSDAGGKPVKVWKQKFLTWRNKEPSPRTKRMGANAAYQQTKLTEEDFDRMIIKF